MPATSASEDHSFEQVEKYAVYDPKERRLCHDSDGAAVSDTREEAVEKLEAVATEMGVAVDRLTVARLTITPADTEKSDSERTTGSVMIKRGPHRRKSKVVEYREVEDGAWAVKTPTDDEFWIFMRSGTERDVHQQIRAKWDVTYSDPDAFTDQSCPTGDL